MMDDNSIILQYLESIERKIDELSPRIKVVEDWQANANGKMTVIGAICAGFGAIAAFVGSLFKAG